MSRCVVGIITLGLLRVEGAHCGLGPGTLFLGASLLRFPAVVCIVNLDLTRLTIHLEL
jgi:hypothetical protein